MSENIFRQFWSLDVVKTEKWLKEMGSKGYRLKDINFITSRFKFEKGDLIDNKIYKIYRHKKGAKLLTKSLIDSGWENVCSSNRWDVIDNKNKEEEIKFYPSREDILKRSKIIKYILGLLLAYSLISAISSMILMSALMTLDEDVITTYHPGAIESRVILVIMLVSMIYVILKLNKSDKKIRQENNGDLDSSYSIGKNSVLDYKTERILISNKKKVVRLKLAWVNAPDKLENYLEEMELKGYNLYKISKIGLAFYFIKGEPRKVAYCVDYQKSVSDSYYEINRADGWISKFTSLTPFNNYIIWAKEYTEEKPKLYSDKEILLKQARKNCISGCVVALMLLVLYGSITVLSVQSYLNNFTRNLFVLIPNTLIIVEFVYFAYLSTGYYIRIKKKLN